jgi:hypothetical protein
MESLTNAAEEILIEALSFKLPGSGQYINERRSVTYQAEGSNTYSSTAGTRVLRFKLSSEGWLDPSTVRIFFDLVNDTKSAVTPATDPITYKTLRPIGPVHAFFRRLRITMRGVVIEDIMDYNRVSEMFDLLSPPQTRFNTKVEGFGQNWVNGEDTMSDPNNIYGIHDRQTVCFKPLCGILMQTKFIPLRYCPLEIELELADADDGLITSSGGITDATLKAKFEGSISKEFHLEMCQLKADVCTLDNALDNSYTQHLMNGRHLPIVYNTFVSNIQTIVAADTQINVSRSLSRLKSVFLSLERNLDKQRAVWHTKNWNSFYSPMAEDTMTPLTTHIQTNEITSLQLQIGSFLIPQYPIRSHSECFYSLRKALGLASNMIANVDIDGNEYRNNRFIVGMDCEKILGLAFTGTNTKNSLMTVRMKTLENNKADRFHILLVAEMVLEVSDAGIAVFD